MNLTVYLIAIINAAYNYEFAYNHWYKNNDNTKWIFITDRIISLFQGTIANAKVFLRKLIYFEKKTKIVTRTNVNV